MSVKQASSAVNRDELRGHYRTVLDFIKKERTMRNRVLAEPRQARALAEAYAAKASLGAAVVWLCADAASFVSGVAFPVDGSVIAGIWQLVQPTSEWARVE